MSKPPSVVCVVDDDESARESLDGLLRSAGFEVRTFASAEEFLVWDAHGSTDCLVLDFFMPRMNGAELQAALAMRGRRYPIIFVTAFAEDDLRPRLLAAGALEVLPKPVDDDVLIDAIQRSTGLRVVP